MKILKFGGSSVGTPPMIKKVGEIVKEAARKNKILVVVSAFQGVTDELLSLAKLSAERNNYKEKFEHLKQRYVKTARTLIKQKKARTETLVEVERLCEELSKALKAQMTPKNFDLVASFGERLSAYIISRYLRAEFLDTRQIIKTDNNFQNAAVNFSATVRRITHLFRKKENAKKLFIVTGFIGSTAQNETTTLGRGGSDYTAAIIGSALNADVIEIWTDVDGVMSADPRLVKNARTLPNISYEEAIEMAYFGAKVIHPSTMLPAIKKKIPILIKNTFHPRAEGTRIANETMQNDSPVKGITAVDAISLINVKGMKLTGIPGSAAKVFEATRDANANVIFISQASSEHTICFAIKTSERERCLASLKKRFANEIKNGLVEIDVIPEQTIIAAIGDGMRGTPGIAGKLFKALGGEGINISAIAQGGSERNISFAVRAQDHIKALNVAHNVFCENGAKNLFIIGTGNVASHLLTHIKKLKIPPIRVCGLMNTSKMLLKENGITLDNWQKKLEKGEKSDMARFAERAAALPLPNKILVDCTASDAVPKRYADFARAGFNIVTPNKKFNVFPYPQYKALRDIMKMNGKKFMYETNVGAALPVIATIRDLIASGDTITKIEGVFSGTLSYLFNHFDGTTPLSILIRKARDLGYTEPDPRDDLSGTDVGRKLLILAREIGLVKELRNVKIQNLVPPKLRRARTIEYFMKELQTYDAYFQKLLERAAKRNALLRYVATLEKKSMRVSLKEFPREHPIASLKESDNIFVFHTERYKQRPLVIQGPGAGAEITAAGVLSDILKI